MATAILPADFQDRLVAFDGVSALPARAVCLGLHELVVSKLVAMREKDFEFSFALLKAGPVDFDVLLDRARLDPDEYGITRAEVIKRLVAGGKRLSWSSVFRTDIRSLPKISLAGTRLVLDLER